MQQFQVPQFIDVEDKIIGPFTLRQFLYLLGAGAVAVIARALFVPFLFYIITIIAVGFSLALAFYKVDGVPFPKILMSAFSYFSKPHLYIWKQEEIKKESPLDKLSEQPTQFKVPKTSESKLEDLAWSLDIKEKMER